MKHFFNSIVFIHLSIEGTDYGMGLAGGWDSQQLGGRAI
jgi:hypothetical protein